MLKSFLQLSQTTEETITLQSTQEKEKPISSVAITEANVRFFKQKYKMIQRLQSFSTMIASLIQLTKEPRTEKAHDAVTPSHIITTSTKSVRIIQNSMDYFHTVRKTIKYTFIFLQPEFFEDNSTIKEIVDSKILENVNQIETEVKRSNPTSTTTKTTTVTTSITTSVRIRLY